MADASSRAPTSFSIDDILLSKPKTSPPAATSAAAAATAAGTAVAAVTPQKASLPHPLGSSPVVSSLQSLLQPSHMSPLAGGGPPLHPHPHSQASFIRPPPSAVLQAADYMHQLCASYIPGPPTHPSAAAAAAAAAFLAQHSAFAAPKLQHHFLLPPPPPGKRISHLATCIMCANSRLT
jgi:hypothetical protein